MSGLRSAPAPLRASLTAFLAAVLVAAAIVCACAPGAGRAAPPLHQAAQGHSHHDMASAEPVDAPAEHCAQCPDREVLLAAAPVLPTASLPSPVFGVTIAPILPVPAEAEAASARAPPRSLGPPARTPTARYDVLLT